jgi:predicted ATPase
MPTGNENLDNGRLAQAASLFLRRVRIRGYKSIAFCDVRLAPLTVLVGRNPSGKSNFLDALAFLRDVMEVGLPEALRRRGGWSAVACRTSPAGPIEFKIDVGFSLFGDEQHSPGAGGVTGLVAGGSGTPAAGRAGAVSQYTLRLASEGNAPPVVAYESFDVIGGPSPAQVGFEVDNGIVSRWRSRPEGTGPFDVPHSTQLLDRLRPDRLLLSVIGSQPFIEVGDGLRYMGFYNFQPEAMRRLQKPAPGGLLERDGSNLARAIEGLREIDEDTVARVGAYLAAIVEEVASFRVARYGDYETVRFRMRSRGVEPGPEFDASGMSDGTLRVLAALIAVFQINLPVGPSVVGIEEPETSLHPAAMRALVDAVDEASARTQVLITTHSANLLDNPMIGPDSVRVVEMIDGKTVITPIDEASREILKRKLNTLGGLERQNQLAADPDDVDRQERLSRDGQGAPA